MTGAQVVCILGMHRSGTSLTARLLNLLGVNLGPEAHLVEPASDNPAGFWEHRRIFRINKQILLRFGGHSHEPPVFPPGWESSPELDDLRQRARAIVHEDFSTAALWGWKDPRTCLTVPFWQGILPSMEYVICVRHPLAVARSLRERDGVSLGQGVYLWLEYLTSALRHTAGQPRILVCYDHLLDDGPREVERLARFLGRPRLAKQRALRGAAQRCIDQKLRHHRDGGSGAPEPADPAFTAQILGRLERVYRAMEQERESSCLPEIQEALADVLGLMQPQFRGESSCAR
jgi:hypothetical protein